MPISRHRTNITKPDLSLYWYWFLPYLALIPFFYFWDHSLSIGNNTLSILYVYWDTTVLNNLPSVNFEPLVLRHKYWWALFVFKFSENRFPFCKAKWIQKKTEDYRIKKKSKKMPIPRHKAYLYTIYCNFNLNNIRIHI